ncbi:MAG: DUF6356 family protein [Pseudomonadota bacterium]
MQTPTQFLSAFRDHPASVGESYFGHMRFALGFAGLLFAAAVAALIHAILPPVFETRASDIVKRLHARIVARH